MSAEPVAMEVAADAEENLPVVSSDDEADLLECEEPSLAAVVAASARIGDKRRPLNCVSRLEFLTDLIAFLKENGDGDLVTPAAAANPLLFPEKKLNQKQLDLLSLYKQVTARGGYFVRSGNRHPFSWSGEIFPNMKHNYTRNHRATSVGHDLIKYYGTYLSDYETAHPKDVVPYAILGTAHGASVAARAAAAPLRPGDRIQVWWPLEKNWFAGSVASVAEGEGTMDVKYDDGDTETLKMAAERWRRERLPSSLPSKKRRPRDADGAGGVGPGTFAQDCVLPAGSKRKRGQQPGGHWRDYVPTDAAFRSAGGAGAAGPAPGCETAMPLYAPLGLGQAGLARLRARAERQRVLGLAPVTRRSAAFFASAEGPGCGFPPASSVAHWLQLRGFGALAPRFTAHEVDWEVLPLLTGEDLQELGVEDAAQRLELLVFVIKEHNARCAQEVEAQLGAMGAREGERFAGVNDSLEAQDEEEAQDQLAQDQQEDQARQQSAQLQLRTFAWNEQQEQATATAQAALLGEPQVVLAAPAAAQEQVPAVAEETA